MIHCLVPFSEVAHTCSLLFIQFAIRSQVKIKSIAADPPKMPLKTIVVISIVAPFIGIVRELEWFVRERMF